MKVYGPYTRKDGRKHVVIYHPSGYKQTQSYPKYLLQKFLNKHLSSNETVDHIDNNKLNDSLDNLQILTRANNARKEMLRSERAAKTYNFICPVCKKAATKLLRTVRGNKKKGKAGPFCSRKCAGIFSTSY